MVQVAWIACPACDKEFYVERPQLEKHGGEEMKWMCPFCKKAFTSEEAISVSEKKTLR